MTAETGTDIAKAANLLENGRLVAIPTETVYGLAANALNQLAVAAIFEAKNRPHFDPLIVHISSIDEVLKYVQFFPPLAKKLAEKFWPGPLTLILPKKPIIPDIVTAGNDSVAIRVPNHSLTLELLKKLDFPLAAPSANPFGYVSPTKPEHVQNQLGEKLDYVLDGGDCSVGIESTIVSFTGPQPSLLRLGGLDIREIEQITGPLGEKLSQNSNPNAPGQLDSHYSPRCKLFVEDEIENQLVKFEGKKIALLRFSTLYTAFAEKNQFLLAPDGQLQTAAYRLFSILRELDEAGYEIAIFQAAPDIGLGRAINDRLQRAAFR